MRNRPTRNSGYAPRTCRFLGDLRAAPRRGGGGKFPAPGEGSEGHCRERSAPLLRNPFGQLPPMPECGGALPHARPRRSGGDLDPQYVRRARPWLSEEAPLGARRLWLPKKIPSATRLPGATRLSTPRAVSEAAGHWRHGADAVARCASARDKNSLATLRILT